jgi:hypothetical protein
MVEFCQDCLFWREIDSDSGDLETDWSLVDLVEVSADPAPLTLEDILDELEGTLHPEEPRNEMKFVAGRIRCRDLPGGWGGDISRISGGLCLESEIKSLCTDWGMVLPQGIEQILSYRPDAAGSRTCKSCIVTQKLQGLIKPERFLKTGRKL